LPLVRVKKVHRAAVPAPDAATASVPVAGTGHAPAPASNMVLVDAEGNPFVDAQGNPVRFMMQPVTGKGTCFDKYRMVYFNYIVLCSVLHSHWFPFRSGSSILGQYGS